MMSIERQQMIHVFSALGTYLKSLPEEEKIDLFETGANNNPWFKLETIEKAWNGILKFLDQESLSQWLNKYPTISKSQKVGLVLAGNIPMVGFHDVLSVLISGHRAMIKMSSQDNVLIRYILDELCNLEPLFKERIDIVERLENFDAVIATGSDNTGRYFEQYFGKYPHIIRKNRTSVAILRGDESRDDLLAMAEDIFSYYGLGCRNTSKVFIPKDYRPEEIFEKWEGSQYSSIVNHHKYVHNYDYNKSIYLINKEPHLDCGYMMLKESKEHVSPISVLFYERYQNEQELQEKLASVKDKIQVISSAGAWFPMSIPFGKAQSPELSDYADNVDTMQFLTSL